MSKKVILVIGPQGSGKSKKIKEITGNRKTIVQNPNKPFVAIPFKDKPDYIVFEEKKDINDSLFKGAISMLIHVSGVQESESKKINPAPVIIIESQIELSDLPSFYYRDEIEIIDLNPSN